MGAYRREGRAVRAGNSAGSIGRHDSLFFDKMDKIIEGEVEITNEYEYGKSFGDRHITTAIYGRHAEESGDVQGRV
jgi:hypothetical protein